MAVGDMWNWTTGTNATYTITGNYTGTYASFGVDFAKPARRAVSLQWRNKDKTMPDAVNLTLHRGNGWVELDTKDTVAIAEAERARLAPSYPKVEWRIEPSM